MENVKKKQHISEIQYHLLLTHLKAALLAEFICFRLKRFTFHTDREGIIVNCFFI
jgi:hypothetical protein